MLKPYIKAFGHAFDGIASFFKTERNAKIHLAAAIAVSALGMFVGIEPVEWLWVASAIAMVLIAEMINSAIEKLCNRITTEQDPEIKVIKDISAGFVVIATLYSLLVAAIIFSPYLFT